MMDKVVITRGILGICHMQVCVEKEATDEEILDVCQTQNPSGTRAGWCNVIRKIGQSGAEEKDDMLPKPCEKYPERLHILVSC